VNHSAQSAAACAASAAHSTSSSSADSARSPRIVPGSAFAGSAAPTIVWTAATTFGPRHAAATTGPSAIARSSALSGSEVLVL